MPTFYPGQKDYLEKLNGVGTDVAAAAASATAAAASAASVVRDGSGGVAGLTLFKINFINALNTFTSFFTNSNTAARTYTFQDRNGTIADDTDLALKAPLASPALTGTPTAPTATSGTNTTQLSTTAFVHGAIADLVNSSPSTLDTLKELADALGDDANFAATTATALGLKEALANKGASGGYVGLTLYKINFKNAANTFTSFFTNTNTAARTYTFHDRDGTIADDTDLAAKASLAGSSSQAFSVSTLTASSTATAGGFQTAGNLTFTANDTLVSVGSTYIKFNNSTDSMKFYCNTALALSLSTSSGTMAAPGVYAATTASAANVFVDSSGNLVRSTSTKALKTDIEDMDPALALRLVELFRAVWYRSLCPGDNPDWSWFGGIAEEVALIDPRFVHFGYLDSDYEQVTVDDGEIDEPVMDIAVIDQTSIEVKDGVPIQIVKPVETQVPRVTQMQVMDAQGNPVKTIQIMTDDEGIETSVEVPLMHPVPVTRKVQKSHLERRLKSAAVLTPVGLQYERFTVPLMIVAKLHEARIAALEAK